MALKLTDEAFVRIAKALADPQRCEILQLTVQTGACCSSLGARFSLSQATISHHLKELMVAGLVRRRRDGQFAYYEFVPEAIEAYVEELQRRLRARPRASRTMGRSSR